MNNIRFTVVDEQGSISFVGPCHAIKMLVAACAYHPQTLGQLLQRVRQYDPDFVDSVRSGIAVFDEHNTADNMTVFQSMREKLPPAELPPFRVFDDESRAISLKPVGTGLILFNLRSRRIVQVQNSYAEVQRADRGRIWRNGRPTRTLYHYSLPEEWRIVP